MSDTSNNSDKSKFKLIAGVAGVTLLIILGLITGKLTILLLLKILLGVLGLSVLVVVHEFGHFIAARAVGVKVITFSIGFGPKLLSKKFLLGKDTEETEFCISILPLGGYCRLKGEHSMLQAWEDKMTHIPHEEGALFSVAPWRRIIVAIAGPLANFLLAVLLMTTLFITRYEIKYYEPKIVLVSEISEGIYPADKAGMKTGDIILSINEKEISTFSDIKKHIAFAPDKEQNLIVLRNGKELELTIKPQVNKEGTSGIIGVYAYIEPVVSQLSNNIPEGISIPFQMGDRITELDGKAIKDATGFVKNVRDGKEHAVSLIRNGKTQTVQYTYIDTFEFPIIFPELTKRTPKMNPIQALGAGTKESISIFKMTIEGLGLIFNKKVSVTKSLSGPIRIINTTGSIALMMFGEDAAYGTAIFIQFIVLISISLAFMNLLPIPALDGGQILLFVYDGITKKPLKPTLVYYYQTLGAVLVIGLVVLAFSVDIFALIGK